MESITLIDLSHLERGGGGADWGELCRHLTPAEFAQRSVASSGCAPIVPPSEATPSGDECSFRCGVGEPQNRRNSHYPSTKDGGQISAATRLCFQRTFGWESRLRVAEN